MKAKRFETQKIAVLLSCVFALAVSLPAFAAFNAQASARSYMDRLTSLMQKSRTSGGTRDVESTKEIRSLSANIDFQELGRRCLGPKRWASLPANEKADFLKVLQDLLEEVAYPQAKKIQTKADQLKFSPYKGATDKVQVKGTVEREVDGEIVARDLEIVLFFSPATGKIVDGIIEGETLSSNFKRQFDEALKKQPFSQIVQRMRKRVDEARKNAT